ncbi:hypothetical protein DNTS_031156, partial [Danionella cerebrum]
SEGRANTSIDCAAKQASSLKQNQYQAEKTSQTAKDMPLGRKTRASSAEPQLETQNRPSILTEFGELSWVNQKYGSEFPDWLGREILRQEPKRHSLALGDDAKLNMRQHYRVDPARFFHEIQIDQMLSFNGIKHIKRSFDEFAKAGNVMMDYDEFESVLKNCPGLEMIKDSQIKQLFMKIDYKGEGKIDWHGFCTYIYQENKETEETVRRKKMAAFVLPATITFLNCWEPVLRIHFPPSGNVMTLREDGVITLWTPTLHLKSKKTLFPEKSITRRPKWATDFVPMPESREIQFYELSSLEPCCQLSVLETVALNLDYSSTGPDECIIVYGDSQGCVNIIVMNSVREKLRLWKRLPQIDGMPNININHAVESPEVIFIRWKVHQDWVSKVKYFQSGHTVVSASLHEETALVIGSIHSSSLTHAQARDMAEVCGDETSVKVLQRAAGVQNFFNIPKGVSTFDLCKNINLLVTAGMDKLIRMWNPELPGNTTGILTGHTAPVSYVCIAPEEGHIYSVSTDNIVMIWHIQDMTCLFTAHPNASQIQGEFSACLYSPAVKGLYIASECLAFLSVFTKQQPEGIKTVSHKEPVLCCGYTEDFQQVVSCSEGSVIKVWDLQTGALLFEFGCAHGDSAITCMAFDKKGRRLMTGGRDGLVKIWNFNNGQCVKILCKEGECAEICDCSYLTLHRNAFVISVGWGRSIDIYLDSSEETQYIQQPKPAWPDDVRNGHKDDILCIAHCTPHLLATGSYDGEIIVWNVVSERIQCRFQTSQCHSSSSPDQNSSVFSLIFLKTRAFVPEMSSSAWLVSSGSHGFVHFWSVLNGGKLITSFQASHLQQQVVKLALTQDDSLLFTADHVGFISVYCVKHYALGFEQTPPEKVNFWRGHIRTITSMKIINKDQYLLTSSMDCSVRLWSIYGDFIVLESKVNLHEVLDSEKTDINKQVDISEDNSDPPTIPGDQGVEDGTLNLYETDRSQRHPISKRCQKISRNGLKGYDSLKDFELTAMPSTFKRLDLNSGRFKDEDELSAQSVS